jgi:hypothetical protein
VVHTPPPHPCNAKSQEVGSKQHTHQHLILWSLGSWYECIIYLLGPGTLQGGALLLVVRWAYLMRQRLSQILYVRDWLLSTGILPRM